ncbi:MAG: C45 family peptidase [Burkholderiales bacterium]
MSMFPAIDLNGSAFERGRQHGERARARVERSLGNYARLFAFVGMAWDEAQRRAAPFGEVIGNFDAALLDEIEGIARGAGRPFGELLALNARTEILPASFLTGADLGECTAIAVAPAASATGGTLLAQNWDWVGSQRESMVILRIAEDGHPACVTLTEAGMLAKIGFNAQGFGVCLNILRSVFDRGEPGVPVHVLLRALLRRASVRDAIEFCSKLSFGGSSNILCADRGGDTASLEFSPRGVCALRAEGGTLCHTNHFLHPDTADWQAQQAPNLSSLPRLARAHGHATARPKHGVDDLKALLRDESDGLLSICRMPDRSLPPEAQLETVASVIVELGRSVMHVAPDVPSRTEYRPVRLVSEGEIALA